MLAREILHHRRGDVAHDGESDPPRGEELAVVLLDVAAGRAANILLEANHGASVPSLTECLGRKGLLQGR